MLYHLCHISVFTMVMQKLGPCRVGYSGRTTEKGSCFNPPRWALGLLYKNVSFMFIQDQSGSFWAACDPFSKASGTCEIYSSAEATHHEGYEGPRLWDDNNPCTFHLPSGSQTWQWKINHSVRRFLHVLTSSTVAMFDDTEGNHSDISDIIFTLYQ